MIGKEISINIGKRDLLIGSILILLGISAPLFINVSNFRIYDFLYESLDKNNQGLLMIAAIRLVLLNGIRGLPHYLGTFIIAESTDLKINGKSVPHIKGLIAVVIIPLVYSTIHTIHDIRYDLGVPAFIVIFAIMYLEKMDYSKISFLKKAIIIILLLLGAQWLDVIPQLSPLRFGRGETSQDIKSIACIIDGMDILSISSSMFFVLFTFAAVLVTKLINDEHKILMTTERNERVERELHETRIKALEARNYIELKHLVHDLKTPLTSIQALVSVIRLMEESPKIQDYLLRIETSIDNLSEMISEILYEDKKNIITIEELFNYILSQISHLPFAPNVEYINNVKDLHVNVNKIRFSRAIINALDNSYNALNNCEDKIYIYVESKDEDISIEVRDNGIGIKEEMLEEVIKNGYSRRKSTGLGLGFIEDIVRSHGGKMYLDSKYKAGTSLKIILPRVSIDE